MTEAEAQALAALLTPARAKAVAWVVGVVLAGAVSAGAAGLVRTAGLATSEDVKAVGARVGYIEAGRAVTVAEVAAHTQAIQAIMVTTGELRDGMYEDRAERLADRAADKVRNARESREVWLKVKARATANQRDKRPLRDGLDGLL